MTRRMVDSITPTDIPVNDPATGKPWDCVLGYVDGHFGPAGTPPDAWTSAAWARFPGSVHVRCAVLASTLDADVLDREKGDATAAEAVAWVQAKRARGDAEPTVYVGLADWPALQAAFVAAGVPHPHYGVAAYPGSGPVQETLNGLTTVFHQYADPQYGPGGQGSGGHYDLSAVVDGWPTSIPVAPVVEDVMGDVQYYRNPSGWIYVGYESGRLQNTAVQDTTSATLGSAAVLDISAEQETALLSAHQTWLKIQENLANPATTSIGSVTLSLPTEWEVTDLGGGVVQIKAKTS